MNQLDYLKGLNIAITISAKDGEILYQNDSSIEVNGDARGRDLMGCRDQCLHDFEERQEETHLPNTLVRG